MTHRHPLKIWPAVCLTALLALSGCAGSANKPQSPAAPAASTTSNNAAPAKTADFPKGPVKLIVSRGAGGSTDTVARLVQPYLKEALGVPVIVENVVGAGGAIGNDQVFKAKPDGYTLLFTLPLSDILLQVAEGTPYDYRKFTPVYTVTGGETNVVAVKADSDMKTFADFVKKANAKGVTVGKPKGVNVASIGMALLTDAAKIPKEKVQSVPYDDGKKPVVAVAGGEIDAAIVQPSNVLSLVKDGKLRVLATFGKKRAPEFPDAPTFQELFPGESNFYEISNSLLAPPGTPAEVVKILSDAMEKVGKNPEFVKKGNGVSQVALQNSQEFAADLARMFKQAEAMKPSLRD